jgi:hypothetical protein
MVSQRVKRLISEIEGLPGRLLALLGVFLGTLVLAFLATHPDQPVWWETEAAVATIFSSVVVYAGYRLNEDDFDSSDAWRVLKMSVAGMVGAVAVGVVFYLLQATEGTRIAEPAFVFEYLGLAGGAFGAGYGILRTPSGDKTESAEKTEGAHDVSGTGVTQQGTGEDVTELIDLLGEDSTAEAVKQRLSVVDSLLEDGGGETPVPSLAVFLTRKDPLPDDTDETESLLREKHLPALSEAGVVEVDEEVDIVRYTGPESVSTRTREKAV